MLINVKKKYFFEMFSGRTDTRSTQKYSSESLSIRFSFKIFHRLSFTKFIIYRLQKFIVYNYTI